MMQKEPDLNLDRIKLVQVYRESQQTREIRTFEWKFHLSVVKSSSTKHIHHEISEILAARHEKVHDSAAVIMLFN